MEWLKVFLEQQQLLSLFLVIGLGYAIGEISIRGFSLGVGAVLFVGLAVGAMAPKGPASRIGRFDWSGFIPIRSRYTLRQTIF